MLTLAVLTLCSSVGLMQPEMDIPSPKLGRAGQVIVGGNLQVGGDIVFQDNDTDQVLRTQVAPRIGVFILPHLFLAADLAVGYTGRDKDWRSALNLSAGPSLGVHLPVAARVSLLPSLGALYNYAKAGSTNVLKQDTANNQHSLLLNAQFDVAFHVNRTLSVIAGVYGRPSVYENNKTKVHPKDISTVGYGGHVGLLAWL